MDDFEAALPLYKSAGYGAMGESPEGSYVSVYDLGALLPALDELVVGAEGAPEAERVDAALVSIRQRLSPSGRAECLDG